MIVIKNIYLLSIFGACLFIIIINCLLTPLVKKGMAEKIIEPVTNWQAIWPSTPTGFKIGLVFTPLVNTFMAIVSVIALHIWLEAWIKHYWEQAGRMDGSEVIKISAAFSCKILHHAKNIPEAF